DYCRRSANPIGRLLLHLYGLQDRQALASSDAICTALQLINFWQDLSRDIPNGRFYLPAEDCAIHQLDHQDLLNLRSSPAACRLIESMVVWSRGLMNQGLPLVHQIPGRAGWELRLVVQGGLRILEKIERKNFDSLNMRPVITLADMPVMAWRALRMRNRRAHQAQPL
ncbi:MAG: squalene/phytoene synthase family protein, partial [Hylemonella sp.]